MIDIQRSSNDGTTYSSIKNTWYYHQDEITRDDPTYDNDIYYYKVSIRSMDSLTEEKDDRCYFYMSSLEMDTDLKKRDETDR